MFCPGIQGSVNRVLNALAEAGQFKPTKSIKYFGVFMKLKDISVQAISLVDKGANRKKRFYIIKRSKEMDDFLELIKNWIGEDELTDEQTAKIGGLGDEKIKELTKAIEEFEEYKENMPEELEKATLSLMKSAIYDYPMKEAEEAEFDIDKAGASLSKATKAQLEKIQGIIAGLLKQKTEKDKGLSDEQVEKLEKAEAILKADEERKAKEAEELKKKEEKEKKDLLERITVLEKTKGVKKSIDDNGGGDDDDDDDEKDWYPSIPVIVKGEVLQ